MQHHPFEYRAVKMVRRMWQVTGAAAALGAGLGLANCLTGCTYVENNGTLARVAPAGDAGVDVDGAAANGGDGGAGNGKPGGHSTGLPSHGDTGGTGGTSDTSGAGGAGGSTGVTGGDAGSGVADAGALGRADAGGLTCLDSNWGAQGGKCCWTLGKYWKPSRVASTVVLSGQTSGAGVLDMSHGYSDKIVFRVMAGSFTNYVSVTPSLVDAAPYMNARLQPDFIAAGTFLDNKTPEMAIWVAPKDACDDSLPPGGILHFTYTVMYN